MTDKELTSRQKSILECIARFTRDNQYPPTVREIGKEVGLNSPASVQTQLNKLAAGGYIKRDSAKSRSMVVTDKYPPAARIAGQAASPAPSATLGAPDKEDSRHSTVVLPLVGRVAAGEPILAEQNISEEVALDVSVFGDANSFLLTVHGESMIEAGILDGDVLVVREAQTANNGDIVVALLGDEATVKVYYREADCIRLQPCNESMEPIFTREVQIMGIVTGLYRRL